MLSVFICFICDDFIVRIGVKLWMHLQSYVLLEKLQENFCRCRINIVQSSFDALKAQIILNKACLI